VRAVNLIPSDALRGDRTGPGAAVVGLLGGLAVLLAFVTFYVLSGNTIKERRAELAALDRDVAAAQAAAAATRPYVRFAALAQARVETIRQLGTARFDWSSAFAEIAKVIPENVSLTSLTGTVTTGVSVSGGASNSLRGSLPNPAIELSGCTVGHESVARMISRLRLLSDVVDVALSTSSKDAGGECTGEHSGFPAFEMVVFFDPIPVVAAPVAPQATPVASDGTSATPPPASSTAPAAAPTSTPGVGGG
jgi:Tfp pilus assembly protein PilN